ncbi:MAG: S8 family serine peptidase, partial [Anaerolineales bacterium]|nr:S8 family serine peptidase [Anaerolineales bacterium]
MTHWIKRTVLWLLLGGLALAISLQTQAAGTTPAAAAQADAPIRAAELLLPGQLVVRLTPAAAAAWRQHGRLPALAGLNEAYRVTAVSPLLAGAAEAATAGPLADVFLLTVPRSVDLWQMAADYAAHPAVVYAEANQRVWLWDVPGAAPDATADPNYALQWSLNNTGQTGGTPDADIDMDEVYTFLAGSPPVYDPIIAVLDTGIELNHPDLDAKLLPGYDFVSRDNDPSDTDGHGTGTASVVAAETDNGVGMAGVCPNCLIRPFRVGTWVVHFGSVEVARGIYYAAHPGYGNADIISMSLGGFCSDLWADAVNYAYNQDVLMVAAAGNYTGPVVVFPAKFERVMAISATDHNDDVPTWSAFGSSIDVAAPGQDVPVADRGGSYDTMTGTSSATPHVAGLAGLLLGQNPSLSNDQLRQIIRAYAQNLGLPGFDWFYGYGRINAYETILQAQNPPGSTYDPGPDICTPLALLADLPGSPAAKEALAAVTPALAETALAADAAAQLQRHKAQIAALVLANPPLRQQLTAWLNAGTPLLQAWAAGEPATLDAAFARQTATLYHSLRAVANPELQRALDALWLRLDLETAVGRPI